MMYIAITPHGKQFPRNILKVERKAHLLQAIKDKVYSNRYDLSNVPSNLNRATIKQLLEVMDHLEGERHTKTTRKEYLKLHSEKETL